MRNSNCLPAIFFWEKLSKVSKSSAHTLQTNENHLIDWKLKGNDRSKIACQDPVKNTREIAPWFDDFLKPRSLKNGDAVLFLECQVEFWVCHFLYGRWASWEEKKLRTSMVAGFFWLEFDYHQSLSARQVPLLARCYVMMETVLPALLYCSCWIIFLIWW